MGDPVRVGKVGMSGPLVRGMSGPLVRPARAVRGHAGRVSLPKNDSFHFLPRQDL